MEEVNKVSARGKVDRCQHLTKVEGSRERAAAIPETVHIITSMVRHDSDKAVNVRQELGKEKILDSVPVHNIASTESPSHNQERKRKKEKVNQEVRSKDNAEELPCRVERIFSHDDCLNGDCVFRSDAFRKLLALAAESGEFELFIGVGCVVEPFPRSRKEGNNSVLDKERGFHVPKEREVVLNKIRILSLGQVVVMAVVMLNVPRLRHHPVEPITQTPPERSDGKLESIPASFVGVTLVKSAVTRMVCDDCPSRKCPSRESDDGKNIDVMPHCHEANRGAYIAPHDDLVEMTHIFLTLFLLQPLA